jgi:O-antigen/teichoic acid export membrane protein
VSIWMALGHTTAITWAFVLCCVSFLTALATVTTVTIRLGLPNFRFMSAAGHIKEGLLFSIASSTTTAYNDIDKAMLIRFGFQSASGIYGLAYRIVDISCAPIRSLHGALLPRFFQAGQHGVERAASMAKRLQQKTLCYAIAVACCMYALAPMLTFVVGGSFRESASALRWLCLIPALRSLHLAAGDALTGAGHQNYRTSSQLCVAVLNILLNCFLIPVFGWKGAAFASLVSDGTLAASNWMILMVLNRAQTGIAEVGAPLTVDVPVGR